MEIYKIALLAAVVGVVGLLFVGCGHKNHFAHHDKGHKKMMHEMFKKLDLSFSQKREIKSTVRDCMQEAHKSAKIDKSGIKTTIANNITKDTFNSEAMQESLKKVVKEHVENNLDIMIEKKVACMKKVYEIITPEQRAILIKELNKKEIQE